MTEDPETAALRRKMEQARAAQGLDPATGERRGPLSVNPLSVNPDAAAALCQPETEGRSLSTSRLTDGTDGTDGIDGIDGTEDAAPTRTKRRWRSSPSAGLRRRLILEDHEDAELIRLSFEYQKQILGGLSKPDRRRRSLLFDFVRAVTASPRWWSIDPKSFAATLAPIVLEVADDEPEIAEIISDLDTEDLELELIDARMDIRGSIAHGVRERALVLSKRFPLTAADGCEEASRWPRFGEVLSLLAVIDAITKAEAFVSTSDLAEIFEISRNAAHKHTRRAEGLGWIKVLIRGTRARASRYRFAFDRLRSGWREEIISADEEERAYREWMAEPEPVEVTE